MWRRLPAGSYPTPHRSSTMTTRASARRLVGFLGILFLGMIVTARSGALPLAQNPGPQTREVTPAEPKAGPTLEQLQAWEREEEWTRAREDMEILELQLGSKRAQLRKAELR